MRSLLLVLGVLAVVGALCWYLLDSESGGGDVAYEDADTEQGREAVGPALTAAGSRQAAMPEGTSGTGWIQGTVARRGKATGGRVELRQVEAIDPRNPYAVGPELQMLMRQRDAGVSAKPILMTMRAGDDGRFCFQGLATGRYDLRATTDTGLVGFCPVSLPAPGAHVKASIRIPVGEATLEGRIVYSDGKPFQGLVVATAGSWRAALMGLDAQVYPTRSTADGHFSLSGLVPGKLTVSAIISGRMRVIGPPVQIPHAGEYLLTIDDGSQIVRGRVISAADQSPIPGAVIYCVGRNATSGLALRSTESDADGRFHLALPEGAGAGLSVLAKGYTPAEKVASAESELVISLSALGRIAGRVVLKENGSPAAGVTVFVQGASDASVLPSFSSTLTDAEGRYQVDGVAPGLASLHVLGAGWISVGYQGEQSEEPSPYAAEIEPGGLHTVDIEVVPGARVAGTLRTSSGEPVLGAVVSAGAERGNAVMSMPMLGLADSFGGVVTDEDGHYEIDVLAPGVRYRVTAEAPELTLTTSEAFTTTAGKTQVVDLVMSAARYLHVLVVTADGRMPVAGARLRLDQEQGQVQRAFFFGGDESGPRTDKRGRIRLGPLRAGDVRVHVSAPGFMTRKDVRFEDGGGNALSLTLELTRGLVVAGQVILPDGLPVQRVRVRVSKDSTSESDWFHQSATVSAAGTFRVDTIEGQGLCHVVGELTWEQRTYKGEVEVEAGTEDVRLELHEVKHKAVGHLVVTILDAEGQPVPSGTIQLCSGSGNMSESSSQSFGGGQATFLGIRAGGWIWIAVHGSAGNCGAVRQGPLEGIDGKLEVRLPPAQTISGRVIGPDGEGVQGVRLSATPEYVGGETFGRAVHAQALSDEAGHFTLKGLGAFEYSLGLKVSQDFAQLEPKRVRAGSKDVLFRLPAGLAVTLTVLDFRAEPVPGAIVEARSATSEDAPQAAEWDGTAWVTASSLRTDQAGQVVLRRLVPDKAYQLTVRPPAAREDLQNFSQDDWRPNTETIRLKRAWRIEGRVRDQKGRPAQDVWVCARLEGTQEWTSYVTTNRDGAFVFGELDGGRYELQAAPEDAAGPSVVTSSAATPIPLGDPVVVPAGTKGVQLELDIGEELTVHVLDLKPPGGSTSIAMLQGVEGGIAVTIGGSWSGLDRVVFKGLRPDTSYDLWITALPGNRYAHKEAIRAQAQVLTLTPKPGQTLAGQVSLPAAMAGKPVTVRAGNTQGPRVQTEADPKTGRFKFEGLPAGTFMVDAFVWHDGAWVQGDVVAKAGDTDIEIVLKKGS